MKLGFGDGNNKRYIFLIRGPDGGTFSALATDSASVLEFDEKLKLARGRGVGQQVPLDGNERPFTPAAGILGGRDLGFGGAGAFAKSFGYFV